MNNSVSVVVVNWNAGAQLRQCVHSVLQNGGDLVIDIIVVDNGSSDGSDRLIEGLPKVSVVRTGQNSGFGKACNIGEKLAKGSLILFLNPDARIFPATLGEAVACMERSDNATVGICGVKLVDEQGHVARCCARFPTVIGMLACTLGLERVFPSVGHFMHEWDHENSRTVDHVIGAFFLVRRCVFDALDGFDERFFVYLEDLDFSKRAKIAGWSTIYISEAEAFHAGGGTSRQVKARRLFYSLRSRILYAFKHFGFASACAVLLATVFLEPISRTVFALGRGSVAAVSETCSAYGMLFRWLPQWWFKGKTR